MAAKNLQDVLDATPNTVELLRNSQLGAYVYPVVPSEFSNWRREQRAWRESAVLFDQSHHMVNLFMRGPGAIELISATAINSVANFPVNMAKQFVPTTPAGNVIGDGILFHLDDEEYVYVGRAPASNWLSSRPRPAATTSSSRRTTAPPCAPWASRSPARTGASRSRARTPGRSSRPLNGGPVEQLKFFRMATMNAAGP